MEEKEVHKKLKLFLFFYYYSLLFYCSIITCVPGPHLAEHGLHFIKSQAKSGFLCDVGGKAMDHFTVTLSSRLIYEP